MAKVGKKHFDLDKDIYICVVYNPPEGSSYSKGLDHDILECIEKDVIFYKKYGNILMCGDFNARVASELDFILHDNDTFAPLFQSYSIDNHVNERKSKDKKLDSRGRDLLDFCISNQIRIINGRVLGDTFGNLTCYTPNGTSTVDYVLVSESILNQIFYFRVCNFIATLSDCHCLLEWSLSAKYCSNNDNNDVNTQELLPGFIWSDDSHSVFQQALGSHEIQQRFENFLNLNLDNQESIDNASNELTDIITTAANKCLKKHRKIKKKKVKHKKWFDLTLNNMRNNLISYSKTYSKYPNDPSVKGHYYKLLRIYSKTRKLKFRQYKQSLLDQIEKLHTENPKQYWQLIDELRGKEKNDNTSSVESSTWLSHFQNLNKPKSEFKDQIQHLELKLKELERKKCFTELDFQISLAEILSAISNIKSNKAPGLDHISNNMIKSGQTFLLPCLQKIFNACLTFGNYPEPWSIGYMSPIHKCNDASDPNNYRGITITNALGKLFNKILDNRLCKFLDKYHIIQDCQLGFTKKARTSDHMFILKTIIDKYCKIKDGRLFACFVDFQKAFDTIIHTGIKIKLLQIGVGSNFYNIIKNMYAQSKSCIRLNNRITNFFPTKVGVRQGDNLSPNLFKIFINDLPDFLRDTPDSVKLNSNPVHCLLYADDIVLLSSSAKGLQSKLDKLNMYCKKWCLNINTKKTKVLIFNKAGRHIKQNFTFNDVAIDCVQNYKYLGITFCASGSFALAQRELYNKALKAYHKLRKDFLSFNPDVKNCLHVFDHTIKPILLYGSEVWGCFNPFKKSLIGENTVADQMFSKLISEKLHVRFCKFILGVNKKATNFASLSELGRFPIHFDIVKSLIRYWYRLENLGSCFPLLKDAYLDSKSLYEAKTPSWYGAIKVLLKSINGISELTSVGPFSFKHSYKKHIFQWYQSQWGQQMKKLSHGKLCSYSTFKTHFGFENYLLILKSHENRQSFAKLRISAHKLRIEQGRYQDTLRHNRLCLRCTLNEVDDEKHFLFSCTSSPVERNFMYTKLRSVCRNYDNLDSNQKLIWTLNTEDADILLAVCTLIKKSRI